jgi:hypothetical protein
MKTPLNYVTVMALSASFIMGFASCQKEALVPVVSELEIQQQKIPDPPTGVASLHRWEENRLTEAVPGDFNPAFDAGSGWKVPAPPKKVFGLHHQLMADKIQYQIYTVGDVDTLIDSQEK